MPPPPVHFWKYAHVFAIQNIWRPEEKFGNWEFINRQIQKYGANHNKDGPKTKVKMKTFLTALSSVLYHHPSTRIRFDRETSSPRAP